MSVPTYGLQDIKKEIQHLSPVQTAELCLRLARYKKENKVKAEAGFMFSQLPVRSYDAAKSMRKILRLLGKYTKFTGSKEVEIDLLLNFCNNYIHYTDRKASYKPLRMILTRQMLKVRTLIGKLHEDVQADYTEEYNQVHLAAEAKFPWLY